MKRNSFFIWPALTWSILLLVFTYWVLQVFCSKPSRWRFIDLMLFTGRFEENYNKIYKKPYTKLRTYQEIHFTGENNNDIIKLNYARIRIHEITQQQDTINGIHFSFGDSTRYSNFINTFDVLRQERAERYLVDTGGIWFIWGD
ncbi:hypothetical protein L3C95_18220 [Chitinophaga filiformis]|uniref:hypothetical protein n=1 Tax=Chitinophaga filiformis TaxID=104663 RepID=UPI001F39775F|nr:hypothetical protein [Chitinophaga filiformis]MCF6404841.1 hypothetical protein [Chitinophaga filiformis]